MKRRHLLKFLAGIAPAATIFAAQAQTAVYPAKPIRMIVSTSAGGMTDVVARLYAESVSKALKQPVVVENMPGASTLLSSRYVAKQAPDGYTLLVSANTIVTMPHVEKNAGYDMTKFTGIAELSRAPSLLVVGGKSKSKSIAELVAAAKQNPGAIHYGFTGHGTTSHLTAEMFARSAGVRFGGIPYKGIALAVPDVVSGRVEFLMGPATSTEGLIKSGQMRALAITSSSRSPAFPDVPTFKELGYPDVTFSLFFGVLAPAGTPDGVRNTLANAMEAAKKDPKFIERLKALGQDISDVRTPDQFNAFLRQEEDKSVKLIKASNDLFKPL
jgi:tripartite-type tricarboxylate transporter receptor subunit TctC